MDSGKKGSRGVRNKMAPSAGKLFIGGLSWETPTEKLTRHFEKYGEIVDSVVMRNRNTRQPRGFGFVTYADPSVIDKVLKDTHLIDGRTVEIKRSIPRESMVKGPRTRKIFVGGLLPSITEGEFKRYFSQFGEVVEAQIMLEHGTGRPRGFGFITFDSELAVDNLLSQDKTLELGGKQVEIKEAEPKKAPDEPSRGYRSPPGKGGLPPGRGGYGYGPEGYNRYEDTHVSRLGYRGSKYGMRSSGYGDGHGGYGGGGFGDGAGEYGGGGFGDGAGEYGGWGYGGAHGSSGFGGYRSGGGVYGGSMIGQFEGDSYGGLGYSSSYSSGYYGGGSSYGSPGAYGSSYGPSSSYSSDYGYGRGGGRYHPYGRN